MYAMRKVMASTRKLQHLMHYVGRNWITGSTWPPSSWSMFMKSIWTNNNIKGRHLRLNRCASVNPSFLCISWSAFFTGKRIRHPFKSGLFLRSYGESRKKKVLRPPDQDIQPLEWVQLWFPQCNKTTKDVFLPQWSSIFIKHLCKWKTALLGATAPCFRHWTFSDH